MAGVLTAVGEAKVALSIGGTPIAFAAIRIGDGNGAPITPNRLMTDLVHRVGTAYAVTASARDPSNPTHWRVTTEIPAGEGPFTCREIAVFDDVGDMIAIASHPVVDLTGPGSDEISIVTDIVFPVSGTANIAVSISPQVMLPIARHLRPFWLAVESATTVAPPGAPAVGATYVVPAGATGLWTGQAGNLVQWTGEGWSSLPAPTGHVVCCQDKAEGHVDRFLRKTATGWVSAQATDTAFGFSRRATDAEVATSTGTGFVTPTALSTRLENYFTEAESDGRFVKKAGDTMTGTLTLATVGNANAIALEQGGGARYSWYLSDQGGGYYNQILYGYGGAAGNGNRVIFSHTGDIQQVVGNLGLGVAPVTRLDVNGATTLRGDVGGPATGHAFTIGANPVASGVGAGGFVQVYGSTHAQPSRVVLGTANVGRLDIGPDGSWNISGDKGTTSKVLTGNATGSPAWKSLSELGIGKKIIAIGSAAGSTAITFATAEPDTAYSGIVICGGIDDSGGSSGTIVAGSLSAKTTTGCTVTYSGDGGGTYDTLFYIIYR